METEVSICCPFFLTYFHFSGIGPPWAAVSLECISSIVDLSMVLCLFRAIISSTMDHLLLSWDSSPLSVYCSSVTSSMSFDLSYVSTWLMGSNAPSCGSFAEPNHDFLQVPHLDPPHTHTHILLPKPSVYTPCDNQHLYWCALFFVVVGSLIHYFIWK